MIKEEELGFKALQTASRAFLTAPLPDNWEDLGEIMQYKFLGEHTCTMTEGYDADKLFTLIEDHAGSIKSLVTAYTA